LPGTWKSAVIPPLPRWPGLNPGVRYDRVDIACGGTRRSEELKAYLDCFPCFARQALEAGRMATKDAGLQREVLQRVAALMADLPLDATPIDMGQQIHDTIKETTGCLDPYSEVKRASNEHALSISSGLRQRVEASPDSLLTAVTLAAVGNTIDFGANPHFDLEESIRIGLAEGLADSDFPLFTHRLKGVDRVLYLGDNAGEIVFDKILVEKLVAMGLGVTFVVRGGPVINDATMEDARAVGMDEVAEVISSGVASPGTILPRCPPGFIDIFNRAELIIAKGQGNYEGLSQEQGPIFFLLKVKCPVVARYLGAEVGNIVLRAQRTFDIDPQ
jgi:uncharacterized protein with ATP-grasp and redox domains